MTNLLSLRPLNAHQHARLDREGIVDALTRRELIGAGLAAIALAACSSDDTSAGTTTTASTEPMPWNFVDDRGAEVSLPALPSKVVVYEDFLPTLWERGVRPVGVLASSPLAENPYIAATAERLGIDLDSVAAISTSYGDVNVELLASLEPDLIVSYYNLLSSEEAYGFSPESQPLAAELAPFALFFIQSPVSVGAARADQLAVALGGSTPVETDRQRYEAAFDRLVDIAAAQPGLSIVAVVPNTDNVFIAGADIYPLTAMLKTCGFTTVDGVPGEWAYSWENFPTEAASDVLFLIVSPAEYSPYKTIEQVGEDFPTWSLHPAIAAKQAAPIYPNNLPPHWPSIAGTVEGFADFLATVEPLG